MAPVRIDEWIGVHYALSAMTSPRALTLAQLRGYAIARSLFAPTMLPAALRKTGYVQADPKRAPSRAAVLAQRHCPPVSWRLER